MWDETDFPTALLKTHSIEMALYKHTYQLWSFCFLSKTTLWLNQKQRHLNLDFTRRWDSICLQRRFLE